MKKKKQEYFAVTYVCREDIAHIMNENGRHDLAEKAMKISNEDMQRIAEGMGDSFVDSGDYWEYLKYFAERLL